MEKATSERFPRVKVGSKHFTRLVSFGPITDVLRRERCFVSVVVLPSILFCTLGTSE